MIKLLKSGIGNKNYEDIVNRIGDNQTIIITSNNVLIEYKKFFSDYGNVRVYDFKTFIYQIYQKYINKLPILNSNEQTLYFIKAIKKIEPDLNYLGQHTFNIIEDLISIYKNETNYSLIKNIYQTELIYDIELIINTYLEIIQDKYIDEQILYKEVKDFLSNNKVYKNIDFVISDIYYFNEIEKELIKELINNCQNGYLYFFNDIGAPGLEIHTNTFNYFNNMGKVETINESINLEKKFVINNLYRLDNDVYNESNYINIYGASDLYDEVTFVANKINYLIRTKKMRYRDFAIVSNSISEYENYFDLIFNDNNIPYHKKTEINYHFFDYILNLLDVINSGVTSETLIKLLKSKYYNVTDYQINQVINNDELDSTLEVYINNNILKPLEIKDNNVKVSDILILIYNYLETFEINIKINRVSRETWVEFIKILDSIANVYQNDTITVAELKDTFEYFFNKVNVKTHYLDEVIVGDLNIINSLSPKVVFFIGVNEGMVPKKESSNILLNFNELSKYYQNYPKFNNILIDKLNTFYAIVCPEEYLFVTYYKVANNGSKTNPAPLVNKIKSMYKKIKVYNKEELNQLVNLPNLTYNHYLTLDNNLLKDYLKSYFENNENYQSYNRLINSIFNFYNVEPTNMNHIDKIYLSPSSIDTYNNCPFQYFCKYVLRIDEKEAFKYDNRIVGTYIHYMFEKLIKNKATKDNIKGLLKFWKQEFIKDHCLNITATIDYFFNQLNNNVEMLWPFIYEEIDVNKFQPQHLELDISSSNKFPPLVLNYNNITIYLRGIIDRVDLYNNYIRVIDYKTGSKTIVLNDVVHGLNLQLFIYLLFIQKSSPNLIPAGAFYMPSLVKYEESEFSFQNYRLTGMLLDNEEVIEGLGGKNINNYIDAYSRNKFKDDVLVKQEEINELLNFTEKTIVETAHNILSGNISIKPFKEKQSCKYCIYKPICGIEDRSKNYRKLEKYSKEKIWSIIRGEIDEMDN